MALLVQKFGGTSVGSIGRIQDVAEKIAAARTEGHDLVVVVSAMSGETNRLLGLAQEISEQPSSREMDVLLSTGEQVTIALLTMALEELECQARSFTGAQVHIRTDSAHNKARIVDIDAARVKKALKAGQVVVIAGFQGIDEHGNITTLGRGGSDTTAVAMAAALDAEIYLRRIVTDRRGFLTRQQHFQADTDAGIEARTDAEFLPTGVDDQRLAAAVGGAGLTGQALNFFVVNQLTTFRHAVRDNIEKTTGKVDCVSVGQMSTVCQTHRQDGISGI